MRRPHTIVLVAAALASALVAAAAAAGSAATSTPWNRISGPTAPGAQLGLARTSDGVLHVIWNRGATPTSIFETRLSSAGKTVGTSTVAGGWNGNNGLALVVMRDRTLQLFKGLVQVCDNVLHVFDTNREAHQAVGNADAVANLFGHGCVGHLRGQ